jgi:EamA domain-containing membrane protein RarD
MKELMLLAIISAIPSTFFMLAAKITGNKFIGLFFFKLPSLIFTIILILIGLSYLNFITIP